jgi:hypothetical protein
MAAPIATRRFTKDDVLALHNSDCYELVDGQLVERAVSWESSWLGARAARFIGVLAEPALGFVAGSDNRLDGSVTHLGPGEALDGEDVLPGFWLPLAELFGGLYPRRSERCP